MCIEEHAIPRWTVFISTADFCTGRVFGLVAAEAVPGQPSTTRQLGTLNIPISAFGEDASGELYVLGYLPGAVYQLTNV